MNYEHIYDFLSISVVLCLMLVIGDISKVENLIVLNIIIYFEQILLIVKTYLKYSSIEGTYDGREIIPLILRIIGQHPNAMTLTLINMKY